MIFDRFKRSSQEKKEFSSRYMAPGNIQTELDILHDSVKGIGDRGVIPEVFEEYLLSRGESVPPERVQELLDRAFAAMKTNLKNDTFPLETPDDGHSYSYSDWVLKNVFENAVEIAQNEGILKNAENKA
jgi:hypothetical protein